jgi:hypothetical protein
LFVNSLYPNRGVVDSAYDIADAESRRLRGSVAGVVDSGNFERTPYAVKGKILLKTKQGYLMFRCDSQFVKARRRNQFSITNISANLKSNSCARDLCLTNLCKKMENQSHCHFPLKVHKIENFLTPILEFALFLC